MSWSVSYVGTPDKICEGLDNYQNTLGGYSRDEFDRVLPHLKALVSENFLIEENSPPIVIRLTANGYGTIGNKLTSNTCQVNIENLGNVMV